MSICATNPPLSKARNRYGQVLTNTTDFL